VVCAKSTYTINNVEVEITKERCRSEDVFKLLVVRIEGHHYTVFFSSLSFVGLSESALTRTLVTTNPIPTSCSMLTFSFSRR
jgi:hypothetical protein